MTPQMPQQQPGQSAIGRIVMGQEHIDPSAEIPVGSHHPQAAANSGHLQGMEELKRSIESRFSSVVTPSNFLQQGLYGTLGNNPITQLISAGGGALGDVWDKLTGGDEEGGKAAKDPLAALNKHTQLLAKILEAVRDTNDYLSSRHGGYDGDDDDGPRKKRGDGHSGRFVKKKGAKDDDLKTPELKDVVYDKKQRATDLAEMEERKRAEAAGEEPDPERAKARIQHHLDQLNSKKKKAATEPEFGGENPNRDPELSKKIEEIQQIRAANQSGEPVKEEVLKARGERAKQLHAEIEEGLAKEKEASSKASVESGEKPKSETVEKTAEKTEEHKEGENAVFEKIGFKDVTKALEAFTNALKKAGTEATKTLKEAGKNIKKNAAENGKMLKTAVENSETAKIYKSGKNKIAAAMASPVTKTATAKAEPEKSPEKNPGEKVAEELKKEDKDLVHKDEEGAETPAPAAEGAAPAQSSLLSEAGDVVDTALEAKAGAQVVSKLLPGAEAATTAAEAAGTGVKAASGVASAAEGVQAASGAATAAEAAGSAASGASKAYKLGNWLGGAGKLLRSPGAKMVGKAAAPLAAAIDVGSGTMDEAKGKHIESAGDIVPDGFFGKIDPLAWSMNAGRYAGNKMNQGYDALSETVGGSGSLGSDIYNMLHKDEAKGFKKISKRLTEPDLADKFRAEGVELNKVNPNRPDLYRVKQFEADAGETNQKLAVKEMDRQVTPKAAQINSAKEMADKPKESEKKDGPQTVVGSVNNNSNSTTILPTRTIVKNEDSSFHRYLKTALSY